MPVDPGEGPAVRRRRASPSCTVRREAMNFPRKSLLRTRTGRKKPARQAIHRRAVRGDPAAWDDAMDMGVVEKVLAPGVEDHQEANLGPQVPWIPRRWWTGFPRRRGRGRRRSRACSGGREGRPPREREDDVEVGDVEEIRRLLLEPLGPSRGLALRTVAVPAGVVREVLVSAVVAPLPVAAEGGGATPGEVPQNAPLIDGDRIPGVLQELRSMLPEDVGHLGPTSCHRLAIRASRAFRRSLDPVASWRDFAAIWRYTAVVFRLPWPRRSWMVRRSVPASRRCVAKLCLSGMRPDTLLHPGLLPGLETALWIEETESGVLVDLPGKSHSGGR